MWAEEEEVDDGEIDYDEQNDANESELDSDEEAALYSKVLHGDACCTVSASLLVTSSPSSSSILPLY